VVRILDFRRERGLVPRRPQFRKPPKWTDLPPVPPILLVLVAGFIAWSLKGKGSPIPKDLGQLKIIGVFAAILAVGYFLARGAYYMYMQKAGGTTSRKVWAGVMGVGLLLLLGTLSIQYLRPAFGLVSLTAWALLIVLIALFEGKNTRPSMFIAKMVTRLEDVSGFKLDDYDSQSVMMPPKIASQEDTLELGSRLFEPQVDDDLPLRTSTFVPQTEGLQPGEQLRWNAG